MIFSAEQDMRSRLKHHALSLQNLRLHSIHVVNIEDRRNAVLMNTRLALLSGVHQRLVSLAAINIPPRLFGCGQNCPASA